MFGYWKELHLRCSWPLNPPLYVEHTNENFTCSYKVHRFILEKTNPWIQGLNWTWIRRSQGAFRKSFDCLTNFQFTSCIQGDYVLYPVGIITFMLFITINKTNHLMSWGAKHTPLKNLQNFKCGILLLLILNKTEGMHLPIT